METMFMQNFVGTNSGGDSYMEQTGMLVGNFEFIP